MFRSKVTNKSGSSGVQGHALRKTFEKLRAIIAILVLFEQLFKAFSFRVLPLILTSSPNMKHFCSHIIHLRINKTRQIISASVMSKTYSA